MPCGGIGIRAYLSSVGEVLVFHTRSGTNRAWLIYAQLRIINSVKVGGLNENRRGKES